MTPPNQMHAEAELHAGSRGFLIVMEKRFQVEVLHVQEDVVRVSFPGVDYPVRGMRVELQFHDDNGFACYFPEVLEGPSDRAGGVTLQLYADPQRHLHRRSWRIETALQVVVRDQVHPRKHTVPLLDLSSGGALIQVDAPYNLESMLEMSLELPGEPSHQVMARVVHAAEPADDGARIFGLRFFELEPHVAEAILRFIHGRLRELDDDSE